MKHYVVAAFVAGSLLFGVAPAEAAGCIKGAIVGGLAAHVTHHSVLLGALGGCIVGKVLSHPGSALSYSDVTGEMLGADTDFSRIAASPRVNIVKLSTLKGYIRNDGRTQAAIRASAAVRALDAEVAGSAGLANALKSNGFAPADVVAVSAGGALGGATLFVNA